MNPYGNTAHPLIGGQFLSTIGNGCYIGSEDKSVVLSKFVSGAVVLTVLMLNKSKRRKEAIAALEKEIQAAKDELATVPETPPLPVGTSEKTIDREKIDERRTKSTIVVGGGTRRGAYD